MAHSAFRVLHVNLDTGKARGLDFGDRAEHLGGSGLAAALYQEYGVSDAPYDDPVQPLIFAIGPLTGYFPLMSKVVCGFKSPYNQQFAESHAGGRLALALRFAGYDALMITGRSASLSVLSVGGRQMDIADAHYLAGADVFATGKLLRRIKLPRRAGHRSIMRIGPAGENGSAYACINVDTYRHFGRLGAGAVMGVKNLKAVIVAGDQAFPLPKAKEYNALYKDIYASLTDTGMMRKYHDLGTPQNLIPLNELQSLPWRNLQQTTDPGVEEISGETFGRDLLLRQTACSGCPVGCIHVGLLRQQFASDHEFLYKQVNYDYESIFAQGSMLGMTSASDVLALLDETEKLGLDVMSSGVALAWATEAQEKGLISDKELLTDLRFDDMGGYLTGLRHIGAQSNDFYKALSMGAMEAAKVYGGEDFACVLGQEMAGYATGEVFFAAQAMGFRHSHLDTGGYSYDQKHKEQDAAGAVKFLVEDEAKRIGLTCMVSCLFARNAYDEETLQQALASVDMEGVAGQLEAGSKRVQNLRWKLKLDTGFDPGAVTFPRRFTEVATWKGKVDPAYLENVRSAYADAIREMGA